MSYTIGRSSVSSGAGLFSLAEGFMKNPSIPCGGESGAMGTESVSARETVSRRRGGAQ